MKSPSQGGGYFLIIGYRGCTLGWCCVITTRLTCITDILTSYTERYFILISAETGTMQFMSRCLIKRQSVVIFEVKKRMSWKTTNCLVFSTCYSLACSRLFIFACALSQFSGRDYLGAWNRLVTPWFTTSTVLVQKMTTIGYKSQS